jgi:dephospho-CoA kinase
MRVGAHGPAWVYSRAVHLFGLTGGIASGKSAVGARFRERGVPVIDADQLAREVVAPGSEGLAAVAREFGEGVLLPDGALDRKRVAELVFNDDTKRRRLNALLHPRITALTLARSAELGAKGEPLACYEAALLVENGVADAFRPLVVVSAPEAVQIARAVVRDGSTEDAARARVRAQMPLEAKVKLADFVVENSGTLADLRAAADRTLDAVCGRLGVDPGRYPV